MSHIQAHNIKVQMRYFLEIRFTYILNMQNIKFSLVVIF